MGRCLNHALLSPELSILFPFSKDSSKRSLELKSKELHARGGLLSRSVMYRHHHAGRARCSDLKIQVDVVAGNSGVTGDLDLQVSSSSWQSLQTDEAGAPPQVEAARTAACRGHKAAEEHSGFRATEGPVNILSALADLEGVDAKAQTPLVPWV